MSFPISFNDDQQKFDDLVNDSWVAAIVLAASSLGGIDPSLWCGAVAMPELDTAEEAEYMDSKTSPLTLDPQVMSKMKDLIFCESLAISLLDRVLSPCWLRRLFSKHFVDLPAGLGLCQPTKRLRRVVTEMKNTYHASPIVIDSILDYLALPPRYIKSASFAAGASATSDAATSSDSNIRTDDVCEKWKIGRDELCAHGLVDIAGRRIYRCQNGKTLADNITECIMEDKNFILSKYDPERLVLVKNVDFTSWASESSASDKSSFRNLASLGQNYDLTKIRPETKKAIHLLAQIIKKNKVSIALGHSFQRQALLEIAKSSNFVDKSHTIQTHTYKQSMKALSKAAQIAIQTHKLHANHAAKIYFNEHNLNFDVQMAIARFRRMTYFLSK